MLLKCLDRLSKIEKKLEEINFQSYNNFTHKFRLLMFFFTVNDGRNFIPQKFHYSYLCLFSKEFIKAILLNFIGII